MKCFASTATVVVCLLAAATPLTAQTPSLDELSLQDLLNVEVTSVARKEQTVAKTAAAVYVITADDIRRSGATTLPDVLRMAPGFSVSQLNANTWSVTSRGFGGLYANKLLVLVDGRSVYTPHAGGVDWDMHLVPLDMIAQIEVIRGPGGSLWGANAVNGVINIITRRADTVQGGRLGVHTSTVEPGTTDVSFGTRLGSLYSVSRARYFGVPEITQAAVAVEQHARGGNLQAARHAAAALEDQIQLLVEELREL